MKQRVASPIDRPEELKQRHFPGICVAVTICIAATFLSRRDGTLPMLIGLLLVLGFITLC